MATSLRQLGEQGDQEHPPRVNVISRIEASAERRSAAKAAENTPAEKPTGLARIYGTNTGAIIRILSPVHLLHTLPPDYPLSKAIELILQFLDELEKYLEEEQAKSLDNETKATELISANYRLSQELKKILEKQKQARFYKSRFNGEITQLNQKIAANEFELSGLERSNTESRSLINTYQQDILKYQFRATELIREYDKEMAGISPEAIAPYMAVPEIRALHEKIVKAGQLFSRGQQ